MASRDKSDRKKKAAEVAGVSDSFMSGGVEKIAFRMPDGLRQFKPEKDKTYRLLFVPFVTNGNPVVPDGKLYFERTYYTHPALGPSKETVLCLARNFKKKCPACDEMNRIYVKPFGELNMEEKSRAKALKPKQRQMFLVLDLDAKDKGIQLLEISNYCFGKHLSAKIGRQPLSEQQKYKTFYNPSKPMYLQVGVSESSVEGGKPFPVMSDIEFKDFGKVLPDSLLDKAVCLDELISENEPKSSRIAKLVNPDGDDGDGADQDDDNKRDDLDLDEEDTASEDDDGEDQEDEEEDSGDDEDDDEGGDEDSDGDGEDADEDEDDDDEDGGTDEDADPELEAGSVVTWLRKGVRKSGTVVSVKGDRVIVRPKGSTEKIALTPDVLTVKPAEKEDKPAPKKPKSEPGKKPGKKPKPDADDDDDLPF